MNMHPTHGCIIHIGATHSLENTKASNAEIVGGDASIHSRISSDVQGAGAGEKINGYDIAASADLAVQRSSAEASGFAAQDKRSSRRTCRPPAYSDSDEEQKGNGK